jgi:DNA-binding MarR family transcriptional regulator
LQPTQFTLLQALDLAGEITQGGLGQLLALDSTSLTRNLKLLAREGWIQSKSGKDRREKLLSLSTAGRKKLADASPAWQQVQDNFQSKLGERGWHRLFVLANEITSLSTQLNRAQEEL